MCSFFLAGASSDVVILLETRQYYFNARTKLFVKRSFLALLKPVKVCSTICFSAILSLVVFIASQTGSVVGNRLLHSRLAVSCSTISHKHWLAPFTDCVYSVDGAHSNKRLGGGNIIASWRRPWHFSTPSLLFSYLLSAPNWAAPAKEARCCNISQRFLNVVHKA